MLVNLDQQPALGAKLFREWCEANFGPAPAELEANSGITLDDIYRKAVEFSTYTPTRVAPKSSGMKVQFIGEEQEPPI